ncbi:MULTISPECIES: HAD family hydrolase [Dietzia]|uniref:HAD family hydrolase n=1 Tax=Dietzia maris TaxID=37915 RepID=A0A365PE90_9ACTN|nr:MULTISPECIES: HAD family hydrolase [Dietzia]MBB0989976.1 HAD family hydrolase [Dietzia sp. SLG510A3-30A2]ODQ83929.1 hydrolase [Dietzia alimentaria]MDJ0421629.1 HAD family hydrolase [Dietzia kunjamensis]MDN4504765.1 HAD family hydrolase [Dietzia maris]MDV3355556.1 HAD family hydrolase [Dietzia sp. IN118]
MTSNSSDRVPSAVCLDMDGTLVDTERLWDIAVYELAEHLGRPLDETTRERTLGNSLHGFFEILGEYTGRRIVGEEFDRLAHRLNSRVTELMRTDMRWRPGAEDLLADIASTRTPVALVTNTTADVAVVPLEFIDRSRFDVVVTGCMVTEAKPAPDPYLLACARLGVEPGSAVAVEDSVTGATAAVAAGCRVLYIPSTDGQPGVVGAHTHDTLEGIDTAALHGLTSGTPVGAAMGQSSV